MKTLRILITGRVQGVGFRDWLVSQATQLGLSGWVRNSGFDAVEAVISGPTEAVDRCIQRCWQGPTSAGVANITITEAPPASETGFTRRSSTTPIVE
jgi:acylphosphatase